MAAMFDTLKFVETLAAAGVPLDQARAISTAVKDSHESVNVATKQDLQLVSKEVDMVRKDVDVVRKDVDMVRVELNARMDSIEARIDKLGMQLVFRPGALIVVLMGAMAALIKLH